MPTTKRNPCSKKYPGVFFTEDKKGIKTYYIRYRKKGEQKIIEEKIQYSPDMTAAKAAGIRSDRICGKALTNSEKKAEEQRLKIAEAGRKTIDKLWDEYKEARPDLKGIKTDEYRYIKHLKPAFGDKVPDEILQLDVDRLRINLGKTKSPQTVKHVLILLDRIVNRAVKKGLISSGLSFKVQKPTVHNIKTEDLSDEQIRDLLTAIENDPNTQVGNMLKLALFTGMRRGEIFKLRWDDVDFRKGFITIRNPKGGKDATIPLNDLARNLLEGIQKGKSSLVFPSPDNAQYKTVQNQVRRIRDAAGIPKDFRPFHGLRHVYASMLASSGEVDMYTLQKLLTHKSPIMTQRYSHLRDEAIKRAANVANNLLENITQPLKSVIAGNQ